MGTGVYNMVNLLTIAFCLLLKSNVPPSVFSRQKERKLPVITPLHDVIIPYVNLVLKLVNDGRSGPPAVHALQSSRFIDTGEH
jgi:hypothetical protein